MIYSLKQTKKIVSNTHKLPQDLQEVFWDFGMTISQRKVSIQREKSFEPDSRRNNTRDTFCQIKEAVSILVKENRQVCHSGLQTLPMTFIYAVPLTRNTIFRHQGQNQHYFHHSLSRSGTFTLGLFLLQGYLSQSD